MGEGHSTEPASERTSGTRAPKVFISYRRDDSPWASGMIYRALVDRFGAENVFMDVDKIPGGRDFRRVLRDWLNRCNAFLAVIGDHWLDRDEQGKRRIDNPEDFVRIETQMALERDVLVIPVLVGRKDVPGEDALPQDLHDLVYRQARPVRMRDFDRDIDRIIQDLLLEAPRPVEGESELLRALTRELERGASAPGTEEEGEPAGGAEETADTVDTIEAERTRRERKERARGDKEAERERRQRSADAGPAPGGSAQDILDEGLDHHSRGELDRAIACYKSAIALDPGLIAAHNGLGTACIDKEDFPEAASAFERTIRLGPTYAEAYNKLGFVYRRLGDERIAAACYAKSLELAPDAGDAAEVSEWLDDARRRLGAIPTIGPDGDLEMREPARREPPPRPEPTPAVAEDAARALGGSAEGLLSQGLQHHDRGELDEAVACYKRAVELKPTFAVAHNNLGMVYIDRGDFRKAVAALERTIELDPAYAEAYSNLGFVYRRLGRERRAAAYYAKSLELTPEADDAAKVGRWVDGVRWRLGSVPAIGPDGKVMVAAREEPPARDGPPPPSEARALVPEPGETPEALCEKGMAEFKTGDLVSAEDDLRRAVAADPDLAVARSALGRVLAKAERYDEAADELGAAVGLDREDAAAYYVLGFTLRRLGRDTEAADAYERFLELTPDAAEGPQIREWIGDVLSAPAATGELYTRALTSFREGKLDEALTAVEDALAADESDLAANILLARILVQKSDYLRAVPVLKRAERLRPDNPEVHFYLGQAYEKRGLISDARAAYTRCLALAPEGPQADTVRDWIKEADTSEAAKTRPRCDYCFRRFSSDDLSDYEGKKVCLDCLVNLGATPGADLELIGPEPDAARAGDRGASAARKRPGRRRGSRPRPRCSTCNAVLRTGEVKLGVCGKCLRAAAEQRRREERDAARRRRLAFAAAVAALALVGLVIVLLVIHALG